MILIEIKIEVTLFKKLKTELVVLKLNFYVVVFCF